MGSFGIALVHRQKEFARADRLWLFAKTGDGPGLDHVLDPTPRLDLRGRQIGVQGIGVTAFVPQAIGGGQAIGPSGAILGNSRPRHRVLAAIRAADPQLSARDF